MLQSPLLIVFHEATSALDNTNEAIIQKNKLLIKPVMPGCSYCPC
jgi:ABC-type bacteriocin/lantibiotic exporter with double-glycine peptidase domain